MKLFYMSLYLLRRYLHQHRQKANFQYCSKRSSYTIQYHFYSYTLISVFSYMRNLKLIFKLPLTKFVSKLEAILLVYFYLILKYFVDMIKASWHWKIQVLSIIAYCVFLRCDSIRRFEDTLHRLTTLTQSNRLLARLISDRVGYFAVENGLCFKCQEVTSELKMTIQCKCNEFYLVLRKKP
jgi:hypothetical protein